MSNLTEQTAEIKKALDVQKASFTQSTGLVNYNLEAPAKFLVPVLTPLRNSIPRVKAVGGTQANWKAITSIDSTNASFGVSEGNRGAEVVPTVTNYAANFVGLGRESSFTFEAEFASEGFDDVRARNSSNLLKQVMLDEEFTIVGGLGTFGLGVTPTPTASVDATVGTTLPNTATAVYCVALSASGYRRATVVGGLPGQLSKTNADGSIDLIGGGNAQISAVSNTVTPTNNSLKASVTAVKGAFAYAWFVGATAATAALAAITTINKVTVLVVPVGTQKANDAKVAADFSQDSLLFDGLVAQCAKAGSNAYVASLDGAVLTSDGAGGVTQIEAALKDRWDNYRLSPTVIYVNSQQAQEIKTVTINAGAQSLVRITGDIKDGLNGITAGSVIGQYLNQYGMGTAQIIPIKIHPNLPAGTILMLTEEIPYPLSNVENVFQMKLRRDYYQIEWPLTSRKQQFGIYMDGVLQHYFPASMCLIQNVA